MDYSSLPCWGSWASAAEFNNPNIISKNIIQRFYSQACHPQYSKWTSYFNTNPNVDLRSNVVEIFSLGSWRVPKSNAYPLLPALLLSICSYLHSSFVKSSVHIQQFNSLVKATSPNGCWFAALHKRALAIYIISSLFSYRLFHVNLASPAFPPKKGVHVRLV